jgi:hypothetical protein
MKAMSIPKMKTLINQQFFNTLRDRTHHAGAITPDSAPVW